MGRDLYDRYPEARELFEIAQGVIGVDVAKMCFEGQEALRETHNTQVLVFTVSAAALRVLKNQGASCDIVAGHSLGEYTALYAAGVLDFSRCLELVYQRGQFMHACSTKKKGAMAAVIGLEKEVLQDLVASVSKEEIVVLANFNSPGQVVISGTAGGVGEFKEKAEAQGAKRVVLLAVEGAFHSPFMEEARMQLATEIEKFEFHTPQIPMVFNVNAQILTDTLSIKQALIEQITSPVRWVECVQEMIGQGVEAFVEVGPNRVLSGLIRRIQPGLRLLNVEDDTSLKKTLDALEVKTQ